ncbi:MAG: TetR/AcrR family transcriptional regulator [Candidatus Obscuribacterales bacterium]|nr:TetR/AcrR family transcriptional regulator [Candidatus Obscuribacterales bacterium]
MPKIVDHEKYRNELLARSFECFALKGYSQLTMRDLAKHLGVSTGTLYHYFPSKESIFEQLVDYQADQDILLASSLKRPASLEEKIEAMLELLVIHQEYLLQQTCLWLEFGRHNGYDALIKNPAVARSFVRYRTWLAAYLELDDERRITFICSYLNGLLLDLMFQPNDLSVKKQSAMLCAAIKAR